MTNEPLRWLEPDSGAPEGATELLRALKPPPPMPAAVRADTAAQVARLASETQTTARPLWRGLYISAFAAAAAAAVLLVFLTAPDEPGTATDGDDALLAHVVEPPDTGATTETAPPTAEPPVAKQAATTGGSSAEPVEAKSGAPEHEESAAKAPSKSDGTGDTAPAASKSEGFLSINTVPWSRVFIDGRDTGRITPVINLPVAAGRRQIGLRTPDGTMHRRTVVVQPAQHMRIAVRLD